MWLLLIIALPTTIELVLLTLGAFFPKRNQKVGPPITGKWILLIPAHNEEEDIGRLIKSINQIDILVIADNCTDSTKQIAESLGATVLERTSETEKGKSYALQCGIEYAFSHGYDWVTILDADAMPSQNYISVLKEYAEKGYSAVQVFHGLVDAPQWKQKVMRIAFYAFNYLRPRGRWRLGFSCGLLGCGFALHRSVLQKVPYSPHVLAEDLWYHWELIDNDVKVAFCEDGEVLSNSPPDNNATKTQRARWEGGRLYSVKELLPKTIERLLKGNWRFIEPLLELTSLPLSYYLLVIVVLAFFSLGAASVLFAILVLHVSLSIVLKGKPKDFLILVCAPFYMLWKLTTLKDVWSSSRKNAKWVRTQRK